MCGTQWLLPEAVCIFFIMQTHNDTASSVTEENPMWMEVLSKYLEHLVLEHPLVRIIGLGFGHQLVARAFGGKVVHDKDHAEVRVLYSDLGSLVQQNSNLRTKERVFCRLLITTQNGCVHFTVCQSKLEPTLERRAIC